MSSKYTYTVILLAIILSLTACLVVSRSVPEDVIRQELESFTLTDDRLILEQTVTDMSATGACYATYIEQWYGTDSPFESIRDAFDAEITQGSWEIWPGDVVEIWRRETPEGLYSVILEDHTSEVSAGQAGYTIPEDVLQDMRDYPTVYLISMGFMRGSEVERCFGQ